MKSWWQALAQPTVTRRLVLAQMATMALLWISILGYVAWQTHLDKNESGEEIVKQGATLALPLVRALADQPQVLRATLEQLDAFQRLYQAPRSEQSRFVMPRIYAWWDNQLIYRSPDAEADIEATAGLAPGGSAVLQPITVAGRPWLQYVESSSDQRARFAVLLPGGAALFGVELWSRSLLVLPLIISLPLLVLPAWWSVRLALRPWRHVSAEIESRGPDDLSPLTFAPKHRELSPLTQAVNRLLERLRAARLRERSFIADAAHELRTPIAAMRVHVEALLGHEPPDRDRELLQGLLTSNGRAGRLVEQLLSLTRSEAAADDRLKSTLDFEALVQDSLAQLAPLAQAASIELELETAYAEGCNSSPATVEGHAESLRSLVDNIVGNAIKYSPAFSTVRVLLSAEIDGIQLNVVDEGPGIPAHLRQRVFDRFYRVADQSQLGSGLGLSIAKAVADSHRAKLSLLDGAEGRGLNVVLTLQREAATD